MNLPSFVIAVLICIAMVTISAAEDIDQKKLEAQLIKHEGKRSKVYKDSEGIPTVGVGFNLKRSDAKAKIEALGLDYSKILSGAQELTETQIETLLAADINVAITDAKSVVKSFDSLSEVRKRVVTDMVFNLGKSRFSKFAKMLAAIEDMNFDDAAKEMKDSKWCEQVKTRCTTLQSMMKFDKDPS